MNHTASTEAFLLVTEERVKQDERWGDQGHHSDVMWATIMARQHGVLCEMIVDSYFARPVEWSDMLKEATQVAAVAMAHLEALIVRHERGDEL